MFLKIFISTLSILVLIKNSSYSMYEYSNNRNTIGAVSVFLFSLISVMFLNIVLFAIKF